MSGVKALQIATLHYTDGSFTKNSVLNVFLFNCSHLCLTKDKFIMYKSNCPTDFKCENLLFSFGAYYSKCSSNPSKPRKSRC